MAWAVILGSYFCMSTDWQKEVERAQARLAVDNGYQGAEGRGICLRVDGIVHDV